MSGVAGRRRTGGRSARVRRAVLETTVKVVAGGGAEGVNIREIARQADVHDTSVYRRWPTKEHLIFDAPLDYSQERLPIPDTGTLRGDLMAYAALFTSYAATPIGQALRRVMAVAEDDAAMAAARAQFWQSRLDRARATIHRAIARGELAADTDPATALELFVAPLHFRLLLTRLPIDDNITGQLVDVLVNGLAR
ncbi:MAG: TetR/AcrR family transcriptional regulator [Mycobacterium sp.]